MTDQDSDKGLETIDGIEGPIETQIPRDAKSTPK